MNLINDSFMLKNETAKKSPLGSRGLFYSIVSDNQKRTLMISGNAGMRGVFSTLS